jgi:hypothetical protein
MRKRSIRDEYADKRKILNLTTSAKIASSSGKEEDQTNMSMRSFGLLLLKN